MNKKHIFSLLTAFFLFGSAVSAQTTFTNNTVTTITDRGAAATAPQAANPYPSNITVSGLGTITSKVRVTLTGFNHTYQDDAGFLLVSPTGQKVRLMTDCGVAGTGAVNLTFDDAATAAPNCGAVLTTGTYKPTAGDVSGTNGTAHPANFPAPAPTGAYSLLLSSFNGVNPNGVWQLYVDDDANVGAGTLAAWSLTITASSPTAAGTTVGGRVTQPNGSGIRAANVTMLDSMGIERTTATDAQGNYQFNDVPSGLVYVFSVSHLRYQFDQPTRVEFVGEDAGGINFTGSPLGFFHNTIWNTVTKKIE